MGSSCSPPRRTCWTAPAGAGRCRHSPPRCVPGALRAPQRQDRAPPRGTPVRCATCGDAEVGHAAAVVRAVHRADASPGGSDHRSRPGTVSGLPSPSNCDAARCGRAEGGNPQFVFALSAEPWGCLSRLGRCLPEVASQIMTASPRPVSPGHNCLDVAGASSRRHGAPARRSRYRPWVRFSPSGIRATGLSHPS